MASLAPRTRCSAPRAAARLAADASSPSSRPPISASLLAAQPRGTWLVLTGESPPVRKEPAAAAKSRGLFLAHPAVAAGTPESARRPGPQLVPSAPTDACFSPRWPMQQQPSRRHFHTYFVTHLPSSSLHPDSHGSAGPGHKLPRDASTPHTPDPGYSSPAAALPNMLFRDLTVVRIPLRRAKHHFGSRSVRGSRPYNEDADQAGIINVPAFASRAPMSVKQKPGEATPADSASGDPQVFYFGVFDGHGGTQCAHFLRDELHGYIEQAASEFGLQSSLRKTKPGRELPGAVPSPGPEPASARPRDGGAKAAAALERELVKAYRDAIGGYFRRFSPDHFAHDAAADAAADAGEGGSAATVEASLTYAFLRADLDFVSAQARKADPDESDMPVNNDEILGAPHVTPSGHGIGGATRFKGGSTASVALISTPTPAPFWHPDATSTLVVAHVGDSRVLLCDTATGLPQPLTSDHHPGAPMESRRLRRYAPAGSMVSGDSFGEERIAGLANSRAFGDIRSKRIGVSAEPEIARVRLGPAQFAFLVLVTDGVSATLSDQEIVDVVKEARTPEQGARDVVEYAAEVSADGDNATCQVVRLGGWERRSEAGLGSLGTKEIRDARRAEAQDPRRGLR